MKKEVKKKNNRNDGGARSWNAAVRVAPVLPVRDDAIVASMRTQYGIDAQYAAELRDGLVTRAAGASGASGSSAPKRLYYVSPGARELLTAESPAGDGDGASEPDAARQGEGEGEDPDDATRPADRGGDPQERAEPAADGGL